MNGHSLSQHPDNVLLRERLETLRVELRALMEEYFDLQNELLPQLRAKYDAIFREMEVEFQKLTLEASELGRRVEIFSIKKERGETLDEDAIKAVNTFVDKEFARFRQKAQEALDMNTEEREQKAIADAKNPKEGELPKLYREIVKELHPDAVGEGRREFDKFWQSVQDAYRKKNVQRMRALHQILVVEKEFEAKEARPPAELRREVHELENRVDYERRRLSRMKSEEPYSLRTDLDDEIWINSRKKEFRKKIDKKKREIEQFSEILEQIAGKNWSSLKMDEKRGKKGSDDQDFMDNTYFNYR